MALPKQVRKQIEEVEEIEKKLKAPVEEPKDDSSKDGQTTDDSEPNTTEDDSGGSQEEVASDNQPAQSKEPVVTEQTWEHKYHRLQGKYDAEVPRLHAQIKELHNLIEDLRSHLETKADTPKPAEVQRLVTDEEIQEYGSDLVDLQRRIVREEFGSTVEELKKENAKLRELLQKTDSQIGEMTFEQKLHAAVPDFSVINNDPRWIAWLDEYDPIVRGPRRVVAQDAFSRGDAMAVADYVKLFKEQLGIKDAAKTNSNRKAEVERQVQPSREASSSTTSVNKAKRTYTHSEIDGMFKKVVTLGAQQRYDEARKLEAEIDAAFRENRVAS